MPLNSKSRGRPPEERREIRFSQIKIYNILNHHNQYINILNLDVSGISGSSPFIQTEKGGPSGVAGTATDERRNVQFGLRLSF
jgi:hypothetical protein